MNGIASPNIRPVANWDDLRDTPAVAPRTAIARPQAPHLLELLAENQRLIDKQTSSLDALEELDEQLSQAGRLLRGSDQRVQQGLERQQLPPQSQSRSQFKPKTEPNRSNSPQARYFNRHPTSQVFQRQLSERNPSIPVMANPHNNNSIPIPTPIPVPLPEEFSRMRRRKSQSPSNKKTAISTPFDDVFVPEVKQQQQQQQQQGHVTFNDFRTSDNNHLRDPYQSRQGRGVEQIYEKQSIETPHPFIDVYDDHRYGNRPLGSETLSNVCQEISSSMNSLRHQILTEPSLLYKKECSNEPDLATLQLQKIQDSATFAVSSRKPRDSYAISNAFHYDEEPPPPLPSRIPTPVGSLSTPVVYGNHDVRHNVQSEYQSPPRSQAQPVRLTRNDVPISRYSSPSKDQISYRYY